ncbi:MAG TPA: hypothetical protein PLG04_09415, partial [Anaerolineaceae bacterium]|nr:hypothetical protein [Anaerolineaceae bacterium]
MPYDLEGALSAGVPKQEIAEFLAAKANYNIIRARAAGITDDEIISEVSGRLNQSAPAKESSLFERAVKDPLVSLAKGATVGLGEAAVGLADIPTMGYAGKGVDYALKSTLGGGLQEAGEWFDEQLTPEAREAQRKVAEAKGFIPTVQTAIENPSSIVSTIMESAPSMIGGAGLGRAALWAVGKKVLGSKALQEAVKGLSKEVADKLIEQNIKRAITAGAVGEGLVTAGQNIEATRQQTETGTLTPGQVGINLASGALTGTISRLSGGLAKRLGITDLDTLLQGVNTGAQRAGVVAKLKGAIGSAITEGAFEELPQSAQEQMAQNIALGKPIFEGVPEAGAMGLLAGAGMGLMGAGGGMAINRHPAKGGQVKPPTQPPPSEPPPGTPPGGPTFNGFEDFAGAYQDG